MPPKTFSADNKSDKFSACFRWPRASNKMDQLSFSLTCMPMMAYMKKSMARRRQT